MASTHNLQVTHEANKILKAVSRFVDKVCNDIEQRQSEPVKGHYFALTVYGRPKPADKKINHLMRLVGFGGVGAQTTVLASVWRNDRTGGHEVYMLPASFSVSHNMPRHTYKELEEQLQRLPNVKFFTIGGREVPYFLLDSHPYSPTLPYWVIYMEDKLNLAEGAISNYAALVNPTGLKYADEHISHIEELLANVFITKFGDLSPRDQETDDELISSKRPMKDIIDFMKQLRWLHTEATKLTREDKSLKPILSAIKAYNAIK